VQILQAFDLASKDDGHCLAASDSATAAASSSLGQIGSMPGVPAGEREAGRDTVGESLLS